MHTRSSNTSGTSNASNVSRSSYPSYSSRPSLPLLPQLNAAHRTKPQHLIVLFLLVALFGSGLYVGVVPHTIEKLALTQLKPDEGSIVTFSGGVVVTATSDGVRFHGDHLQRQYITGDYIVDFTKNERVRELHGYAKSANEWLIKSPKIGEEAIYLRPEAFVFLSFALGLAAALLLTFMMPPAIGFMAALTEREIEQTKLRLALESNFDAQTIDLLTVSDNELNRLSDSRPEQVYEIFHAVWQRTAHDRLDHLDRYDHHDTTDRTEHVNQNDEASPEFGAVPKGYFPQCREYLMQRVREHFSDSVYNALTQLRYARVWQERRVSFTAAVRLYMSQHFSPRYGNSVSGIAYGGAALLIVAIGLRGLRFISASRPSWILAAISIEFAVLALMALTNFFLHDESGSTSSLKHIETDMHKLASVVDKGNAEFIERSVQKAVEEYVAGPEVMNEQFAKVISERVIEAFRK